MLLTWSAYIWEQRASAAPSMAVDSVRGLRMLEEQTPEASCEVKLICKVRSSFRCGQRDQHDIVGGIGVSQKAMNSVHW